MNYAHPLPHATRGSGRDPDLHVPAEQRKELHQALDREPVEAVAHQVRDVRLHDPEQVCGLRLRELATRRAGVAVPTET